MTMGARNIIGIETRWGFRSFELYEGDLTHPEYAADLLVVSAYRGNYSPVANTLIGALYTASGLDVSALAADSEFDLRGSFGLWISREMSGQHFKRIMCLELIGGRLPVSDVIENIFLGLSILDAKGVEVASVAMPLVGAGSQGITPESVMAALLPAARKALSRLPCLTTIRFVEIDPGRVAALDQAMNNLLGRSKVTLPKSQLIGSLKTEIVTSLDSAAHFSPTAQSRLFDDMRRILGGETARSFEVGLLGRRLAEFVADDLLGGSKIDLVMKIKNLGPLGVAPWIRGYMDTLRLLGNESAHEQSGHKRVPSYVSEEDLAVCLFCIQRILSFWLDHRTGIKVP
jgi:hypothetical protein